MQASSLTWKNDQKFWWKIFNHFLLNCFQQSLMILLIFSNTKRFFVEHYPISLSTGWTSSKSLFLKTLWFKWPPLIHIVSTLFMSKWNSYLDEKKKQNLNQEGRYSKMSTRSRLYFKYDPEKQSLPVCRSGQGHSWCWCKHKRTHMTKENRCWVA